MGSRCSKLFHKRRTDVNSQRQYIVDLREDPLQFPVQCSDVEDSQIAPDELNDGLAGDFVDLREDVVFPVQCTEPSEPNVVRYATTLIVCTFHAPVYSR